MGKFGYNGIKIEFSFIMTYKKPTIGFKYQTLLDHIETTLRLVFAYTHSVHVIRPTCRGHELKSRLKTKFLNLRSHTCEKLCPTVNLLHY